ERLVERRDDLVEPALDAGDAVVAAQRGGRCLGGLAGVVEAGWRGAAERGEHEHDRQNGDDELHGFLYYKCSWQNRAGRAGIPGWWVFPARCAARGRRHRVNTGISRAVLVAVVLGSGAAFAQTVPAGQAPDPEQPPARRGASTAVIPPAPPPSAEPERARPALLAGMFLPLRPARFLMSLG